MAREWLELFAARNSLSWVAMTAPRLVRPGTTWLVTRRITRRHFLLRPDEDGTAQQIYWYSTAVCAKKLGILVHVVQTLSSHMHEVLTDTTGQLPRFNELRNCLIANALKVHRGWPEEVFSRTPADWVELPSPAAMVNGIAYVTANCVAAFLVRTPRRWPGVRVLVNEIGQRVMRVERPKVYFSPDNPDWPDVVELPIVMPEMLEAAFGGLQGAQAAIQARVDTLVRRAHANAKRLGRPFMGAKAVLRTKFTARASSYEPFGARVQKFAAAKDRQMAQVVTSRYRAFLAEYREKWQRWKRGERDVIFPFGTWKMRDCHGALCRGPP